MISKTSAIHAAAQTTLNDRFFYLVLNKPEKRKVNKKN
jgi:hypothetical protein